MSSKDSLDLTVQVPADEWAFCQRRLVYLRALLLQVVREDESIQEWYDAEELALFGLPGMPASPGGIARKATAGKWHRRRLTIDGRSRFFYHVSCLPARAFDALIARILDVEEMDAAPERLPFIPAPPLAAEPMPLPENTAPAWVLPLMRLVKGEAGGDMGIAWRELPKHLPAGMAMPTIEEAATVLVRFGVM